MKAVIAFFCIAVAVLLFPLTIAVFWLTAVVRYSWDFWNKDDLLDRQRDF